MTKSLLATMTGELFQPIRVYYELFDKEKAIKSISKLRCIDYDKTKDRWVWLYQDEAKRIRFSKSYSDIPKKLRPIILGSLYFRKENEMFLELRSLERATEAVIFFDRYINRSIAKATDATIVNRLFSGEEAKIDLDTLFDDKKVVVKNPNDLINKLEPLKEEKNTRKRLDRAWSMMEEDMKTPFPELERFPINFYEDGIASLKTGLMMRQNIALEHWKGNKDFNFMDLFKNLTLTK
jgi:hypothetical protein